MKRSLVLALAVLVLAGCASRAPSSPPRGKPSSVATGGPNGGTGGSGHVFARPTVSFTPVGTVSVGHAHRVNVRNLPSAYPRRHRINCSKSAAARSSIRVTPSPASSQVRICLPIGGTLTVATPAGAYHWSRPLLTGDRGVLQATAPATPSAPVTYRAATGGVAELSATGSPPAGSLGAEFLWTARVIVR